MTRKFLLPLFFLLSWQLAAKANFNYDANCIDAYKAILDLRMNDARLLIQKEKQQDPQNGIIILLENYVDYFSLLASESRADYERLKDAKSTRISLLENNDANSPFYLFSQAEVYLQWSGLKAKFGDFFSSAMDAKKANGLLKDNDEKFPDFLPDKKSLALVNVIFGSIPDSFKGITRFMGMTGNVGVGLKKLEELNTELPKTKFAFYNSEVIHYLCTINVTVVRGQADYPKLLSYLNGMSNTSLLKAYLQGFVAYRTGHNDDAITFFDAAPKGSAYIKLPAMDYLLGCARLSHMDNDAPEALEDYIREFHGTNYIKDSYLKLADFYLLQNDAAKYEAYLKLVKTKGNTSDQKDQQALSEANDAKPDIDLLKARFYFDGGYYNKALAQLAGREDNSFKLPRDKIEYYYRLGRIYDKTGKFNDAVLYYQRAINFGKDTRYYFAANSALSIGQLYEVKHDFKKAADFYNQALDMKDHQYQTDIDNDAKAGLKRVGG